MLQTSHDMDNLVKIKVNTIKDIDPKKRHMVNELTIVGIFESQYDLPILRSMCNTIVDGQRTGGNLLYVDLSYSKIYQRDGINSGCWNGDNIGLNDCLSLKMIVFPCKVFSFQGKCFSGCRNLESIIIDGENYEDKLNPRVISIDGVLFIKALNGNCCLIKYPANKGNEYTLPQDHKITRIDDYAFEDSHLTRLFMPPVPPSCTEKAFEGVDKVTMTLVVPKGCHDSYWMHPVYGKFRMEEKREDE